MTNAEKQAKFAALKSGLPGRRVLRVEPGVVQIVEIVAADDDGTRLCVRVRPVDGASVRTFRTVRREPGPLFDGPLETPETTENTETTGPSGLAIDQATELSQAWTHLYLDEAILDGSTYAGWRLILDPSAVARFERGDDSWWDEYF